MSESNKAINQTAAFDPRSEWFENADIAMVIIASAVAAIVSVNAWLPRVCLTSPVRLTRYLSTRF